MLMLQEITLNQEQERDDKRQVLQISMPRQKSRVTAVAKKRGLEVVRKVS